MDARRNDIEGDGGHSLCQKNQDEEFKMTAEKTKISLRWVLDVLSNFSSKFSLLPFFNMAAVQAFFVKKVYRKNLHGWKLAPECR